MDLQPFLNIKLVYPCLTCSSHSQATTFAITLNHINPLRFMLESANMHASATF